MTESTVRRAAIRRATIRRATVRRSMLGVSVLLGAWCVLGWDAPSLGRPPQVTTAIQAREEPAENSLLDVGIQVLDPGLPEGDERALEDKGVLPNVRKSESRFIPVHLMNTLQATGQWGAVRVLPSADCSVDVLLSGQIRTSNGLELAVEIRAVDSSGREWLERRYRATADPRAYNPHEVERRDPYQSLYNEIANDLLAARSELRAERLDELRELTRLRFAAEIAPDAFADYLRRGRKGRYRVERLPAADDPMMQRVDRILERDHMFVDTLNEYYASFYARMDEPYDDWRTYSYEEQVALQQIRRKARWSKIIGGILVAGGVASGGGAASDAAIITGSMAMKHGIDTAKEARIHVEVLGELAASFDAEVAPALVEVEGETRRLSGSAEAQFAAWRALLREILATETGLPLDPNTQRLVIEGSEGN